MERYGHDWPFLEVCVCLRQLHTGPEARSVADVKDVQGHSASRGPGRRARTARVEVVDVALYADAPTLTTGFGRTTRQIGSALVDAGWRVGSFGLKARATDVRPGDEIEVWPAAEGPGEWAEQLSPFLAAFEPRLLLLNMDAFNARDCLRLAWSAGWSGPILSYVVFDGLPVVPSYLDVQRACDAVLVSSETGAQYLANEGIPVIGVAPPGVDLQKFSPGPPPQGTRGVLGLSDDAFVVGAFGTNTERKQIPRILQAVAEARRRRPDVPWAVYLHCTPSGFWPLGEVAAALGLGDVVSFPSRKGFDEHRGVPEVGTAPSASVSYVDRIRACDIVVNVPHSGDVEQVILEAQACGVPLVHTSDNGIMTEACGGAAVLVDAADVGMGRVGQAIQHVAPSALADALVQLIDHRERDRLRHAGFANASGYGWDRLRTAARDAVAAVLGAR